MDPNPATQTHPSPSPRSVRRRTTANRQAAFSFLSSIQLDPTIANSTPSTQQQQQQDILHQTQQDTPPYLNSKAYDSSISPSFPSLKSASDRQRSSNPSTPTDFQITTAINVPTSENKQRSQALGKKDETAYSFLSTIQLRGDSIYDQDPTHTKEQLSASAEPMTSSNLDNEHSADNILPSSPNQGNHIPKRSVLRSSSSPSLPSNSWANTTNDNHEDPSIEHIHSTRHRKVTSPGTYSQRESQQGNHAFSNGNSGQESSNTSGLSTLLARESETELKSPSSDIGMTLSRRYNSQKSYNRWLGPLTDHVYIKPLIASGTAHIVKKIFRRPSISVPKHQSQSSSGQLTTTPKKMHHRNSSALQLRHPLDNQRHIFYKGDQFANSCVSLGENLDQHAFMFTTKHGSPLMVSSVIKYNDEHVPSKRQRRRFDREYFQQITKEALVGKKASSFAYLLTQSNALSPEQEDSSSYDPYYLDDPELKTGKNRTVISLACYMGSVIQYTRPSDLKRELNEHFRSRHPTIDPSITLSKIRKVKTDLLTISEELDLEISTAALAFAYFEKLVMKGSWKAKDGNNLSSESISSPVTKENRKLMACVCLLLAYKVNEPKRPPGEFGALMKQMTKHMYVMAKDIKDQEFQVFALLEFNLYLPRQEFLPHFEQILYRQDYNNVQEYLGEDEFYAVSPQPRKAGE